MVRRSKYSHGKVRPLPVRIGDLEGKLDKLYLQEKIQALRDKIRDSKKRR